MATVRLKEWIQREWLQPGVTLFDNKGDFYDLSGLLLDPSGRKLTRAPSWSAKVAAVYDSVDAPIILGAFYDEANDRRVMLCQDADDFLCSLYFDSDWAVQDGGMLYTAITAPATALGGAHGMNVIYSPARMFLIAQNLNVCKATEYTYQLSTLYTGEDAHLLASHGDFVYCATDEGVIIKLRTYDYVEFFSPDLNFRPVFLTSFRNYLMMVSQARDGTLFFYRFNDSALLVPLGQIPGPGNYNAGCMFIQYDDMIYFSTGRIKNVAGTYDLPIYSFNGTQFEFVAQVEGLNSANVDATGLLHWRGHLIFYSLDLRTSVTNHDFQILLKNRFTSFAPYSDTDGYTDFVPGAWSLGGELVFATRTGAAAHGIHHAGSGGLSDGYITTSYLDMGSPGKQKRLETLSALVDTTAADFAVIIKYRVDDTAGWTTAVTAENTHRATAIDLGITFYRLQIRVELDDDTAGDVDAAIEAISARYTIEP